MIYKERASPIILINFLLLKKSAISQSFRDSLNCNSLAKFRFRPKTVKILYLTSIEFDSRPNRFLKPHSKHLWRFAFHPYRIVLFLLKGDLLSPLQILSSVYSDPFKAYLCREFLLVSPLLMCLSLCRGYRAEGAVGSLPVWGRHCAGGRPGGRRGTSTASRFLCRGRGFSLGVRFRLKTDDQDCMKISSRGCASLLTKRLGIISWI